MSTAVAIQGLPEGREERCDVEAISHRPEVEEISVTHLLSNEDIGVILAAHRTPRLTDQFLLGSLRNGRLRIKSPITVRCTRENQDIITEAVEFNEFGFGKSVSESLSDLQATIAELYFALKENQQRLGPDLRHVWETLQQKIILRP